ncbi:MAG: hypothetical protein P8X82_14950, partial [Gemmatimonadales bacterium]
EDHFRKLVPVTPVGVGVEIALVPLWSRAASAERRDGRDREMDHPADRSTLLWIFHVCKM